jgi:thiol-disulfide isomerase/thioredoxin
MAVLAVIALSAGVFVQKALPLSVRHDEARPLEYSFPDTAEMLQPLGQWQGKLLVINFWATWCAPCLKEIPEFIKLQAQYQSRGLQFVGIAVDDKQAVLHYLQGININYPMLIAGDGGIGFARKMGNIINAVPYTVIVNPVGQIVYRQPGEISLDNLQQIIAPLLALKGSESIQME